MNGVLKQICKPLLLFVYIRRQHNIWAMWTQNCAHTTQLQPPVESVLRNAEFVFTTTALALHPTLSPDFDHIIVEEGSCCNVATGVACFTRGQAITFVGMETIGFLYRY